VTAKADAAAMKHAVLRPVIEVECKECKMLLGYEANRGDAWQAFFQHWEAVHQ
jgi:hypothetical protein